jgi:iron complex transport system ATP-binding protein
MLDLVRSFAARGMAIVLISHQLGAVADHVEKLVVMAGSGRPVAVGTRAELLTSQRLSEVYGHAVAVRTVDGHSVIFAEPTKLEST